MRWLPALVAGPSRAVLPMADRSAAVLLDVLLADDEALSTELLAEQLAVDPPLVLWAVCVAGRDGFRPRSIREMGRWLRERLPEVLRWEGADEALPDASDPRYAEQWGDRAAKLLQIAELSALLAAADGQQAAEKAFLNGVLHDASQWLTTALGPTPQGVPACLPVWLTANDDDPAKSYVKEAVRILDGDGASAPDDFDSEACRRRAWEARRSWLEAASHSVLRPG